PSAARSGTARAERSLRARRDRSRERFEAEAGEREAHRAAPVGADAGLSAHRARLDPLRVAADLGAGTGALTGTIAPFVRKVIAVDESAAMLAAARRRLEGAANVELRAGALEALPLENAEADVALLLLVLHHAVDPAAVLA